MIAHAIRLSLIIWHNSTAQGRIFPSMISQPSVETHQYISTLARK